VDIHNFIRTRKTKKPQTVEEAYNEYSGYTEEQLMAELFNKGSLSKGTVSAEELDEFYAKALPFLTNEQAEKMRNLIIQLKNS